MVRKIITPDSNTLSLTIPREMVGRQVKVIAFTVEEEADVIEGLAADLHPNEKTIPIPQWQKDLVLAEKRRVEQQPSLLVDWKTIRTNIKGRKE